MVRFFLAIWHMAIWGALGIIGIYVELQECPILSRWTRIDMFDIVWLCLMFVLSSQIELDPSGARSFSTGKSVPFSGHGIRLSQVLPLPLLLLLQRPTAEFVEQCRFRVGSIGGQASMNILWWYSIIQYKHLIWCCASFCFYFHSQATI